MGFMTPASGEMLRPREVNWSYWDGSPCLTSRTWPFLPAVGSPQPHGESHTATCAELLGRLEPGEKEQRLGEGGRRGGRTKGRREERERADGRAGTEPQLAPTPEEPAVRWEERQGRASGSAWGPRPESVFCAHSAPDRWCDVSVCQCSLGPFPHLSDAGRTARLGWWFPAFLPSANATPAPSGL